jgi:uncharacterized protein YraI
MRCANKRGRQSSEPSGGWSGGKAALLRFLALVLLVLSLTGPIGTANAETTAQYHAVAPVSARSTATAAPAAAYGAPAGSVLTAECQVHGEPFGPYRNDIYEFVAFAGRHFFVPDSLTDSPYRVGGPFLNIPWCGQSAAAAATPLQGSAPNLQGGTPATLQGGYQVVRYYTALADISARSGPTSAPSGVWGVSRGTTVGVLCQIFSNDAYEGNRLYLFIRVAGREFFVPDQLVSTPRTADGPALAGVPICGATAQGSAAPATSGTLPSSPGAFKNSDIADWMLARAAGGASGAPDFRLAGQWLGQCRDAVNKAVAAVSSGRMTLGDINQAELTDYQQGFRRLGAYQVPSIDQAIRGDIVQRGNGTGHTWVVVRYLGGGQVEMVDSNGAYDERVHHYVRTFDPANRDAGSVIWRLGRP